MTQQPTAFTRVLRIAVATIFVAAAVILVGTACVATWAIWSIAT